MDNSGNDNRKKVNKKSSPAVYVILLIVVGLSILDTRNAHRFFERYGSALIAVMVIIIASGAGLYAALKAKKGKACEKSFKTAPAGFKVEHSHLNSEKAVLKSSSCDGIDHWREQLDQFKKNGLIGRDEYNKLLDVWYKNQNVNS